jgi:hypothetical protein
MDVPGGVGQRGSAAVRCLKQQKISNANGGS